VSDGLKEFNSMLGLWSNDSLMLFGRVRESFSLTPGKAEYTIGPGADFDTARPLFIASAFVRQSTTDYSLEIISEESYSGLPDKGTSSIPEYMTFDTSFQQATIKLYPAPSSAYTIHILSEKALSSVATLDTEINLPPGWDDAIVYNLAARLYSEFGQEPDPLLLKTADDSKTKLMKNVNRNRVIDWNAPTPRGDIYTGWNR
jgi:hypothetical protein